MQLQIVADLHIEYNPSKTVEMEDYIIPTAETLVLAGDIGSLYRSDQLYDFLEQCSRKFEQIIYVPGNHEFYTMKDINTTIPLYRLRGILYSFETKIDNLKILDRHYINSHDNKYIIAGCTMWSDLCYNFLPKFRVKISGMNSRLYNIYFQRDLQFINNMIELAQVENKQLIMITHYVPTSTVLNKPLDRFSYLYHSNLDYLLTKDKVHTWVCGHIHTNFDVITDGGTHLVGNQKGRIRDNLTDFDKSKVLEFE